MGHRTTKKEVLLAIVGLVLTFIFYFFATIVINKSNNPHISFEKLVLASISDNKSYYKEAEAVYCPKYNCKDADTQKVELYVDPYKEKLGGNRSHFFFIYAEKFYITKVYKSDGTIEKPKNCNVYNSHPNEQKYMKHTVIEGKEYVGMETCYEWMIET